MSKKPEPIFDPAYWRERLHSAREQHHAIFRCSKDNWLRIEAKHREILKRYISVEESVFDVGCGWGRLLTLMPSEWKGNYLGVDISPDFIELAEKFHPNHDFGCFDLRILPTLITPIKYDWAVMISMRPMITRNAGEETWKQIEDQVRQRATKLLYLEYDPADKGSVE